MTPEELRTTAANIEKFISNMDKDMYRLTIYYSRCLASIMQEKADKSEKADKMIDLVRNH